MTASVTRSAVRVPLEGGMGVVLADAVLALDREARAHKQAERSHREGAQRCRTRIAQLTSDAARAGIHIDLTTGEAKEHPHGRTHNTRS